MPSKCGELSGHLGLPRLSYPAYLSTALQTCPQVLGHEDQSLSMLRGGRHLNTRIFFTLNTNTAAQSIEIYLSRFGTKSQLPSCNKTARRRYQNSTSAKMPIALTVKKIEGRPGKVYYP